TITELWTNRTAVGDIPLPPAVLAPDGVSIIIFGGSGPTTTDPLVYTTPTVEEMSATPSTSGLGAGPITGIVIGVLVLVAMAASCCVEKRQYDRQAGLPGVLAMPDERRPRNSDVAGPPPPYLFEVDATRRAFNDGPQTQTVNQKPSQMVSKPHLVDEPERLKPDDADADGDSRRTSLSLGEGRTDRRNSFTVVAL
ncbi:hypothetical protein BC938DRAFT_479794, partial [Jimgerdemannia flammicorona]